MGKKNKSKKKKHLLKKVTTYDAARGHIKILEDGKIKVGKQKLKFSPYVDESVEGSVCGRLDGIVSKEDVIIEGNPTTTITNSLTSVCRALRINHQFSNDPTTIVVTRSKKKGVLFDFMDETIIGKLLRTSTLGLIYKQLSEAWFTLNHNDQSCMTNILFIPHVFVFVDDEKHDTLEKPYMVNLLLVCPPDKNKMHEIEATSTEEAINRIVNDTMDAACKLGLRKLIIEPFAHKIFEEDPHQTAIAWSTIAGTQRVQEHVDTIDFVNEDENYYIIFATSNGTTVSYF